MPNSRNQGQNGGSAQGARERASGRRTTDPARRPKEVGERSPRGYDSTIEGAAHGYRQAEGFVARNPGPSLMFGFGLGFGLGLVLCSMITREETWAERYLPESLQDMPDRYRSLVSSLKSLPRQVHDHLPSSVARHLG